MKKTSPHFEILKAGRKKLLETVSGLSIRQILQVPTGFNNHIGWNFCHILVVQQSLTYGLSGKPLMLEKNIIDAFGKNTKARANINVEFWETMKEMAITTAHRLESDYQSNYFETFKEYTTSSYGYHLSSIENAIAFNNVHEGLHLGYIMAQKRSL